MSSSDDDSPSVRREPSAAFIREMTQSRNAREFYLNALQKEEEQKAHKRKRGGVGAPESRRKDVMGGARGDPSGSRPSKKNRISPLEGLWSFFLVYGCAELVRRSASYQREKTTTSNGDTTNPIPWHVVAVAAAFFLLVAGQHWGRLRRGHKHAAEHQHPPFRSSGFGIIYYAVAFVSLSVVVGLVVACLMTGGSALGDTTTRLQLSAAFCLGAGAIHRMTRIIA